MKKTTKEIWLQVPGLAGYYEVSSFGRVRTMNWKQRRGCIRLMRPFSGHKGHQAIVFTRYAKRLRRLVHRLVLEAFIGPCPNGCEASHKDGNPKNNAITNLVWETPSQNNRRKLEHGTHNRGEQHASSILNEKDVLWIRRDVSTSVKDKAAILGVSKSLIYAIKAKKRWRHVK